MEENQKICKIVEEVSYYLLECGINILNIGLKKTVNKVSLIFECSDISPKDIYEINKTLNIKREESFELYGWQLMGQGVMDHDLPVVSALVNYSTYYLKDGKVYFNLVRYENT